MRISDWSSDVCSSDLRGAIRLLARFEWAAAEHLRESPLSQDQTWQPDESGEAVTVTATVQDDEQLRWWLLAFGGYVEVLEPKKLRREIAASLAARSDAHPYDLQSLIRHLVCRL